MKLNQIIALVQGKKTRIAKTLTEVHHGWHKDRISGISRTYTPKDDDGEIFPPESKIVQVKVLDTLGGIQNELIDYYNIIATQEIGNTQAKADVKVNDKVILKNVPVSVLLFLEKQLTDLRTLASSLPTLPTDKEWEFDTNKNCYVTEPEKTIKTQKRVEPIIKYDATPEHPAQTDLISVDRVIGNWSTIHLSGAMPEEERDKIVEKIENLQDAVKIAREEANSLEVEQEKELGNSIFSYIFTSE